MSAITDVGVNFKMTGMEDFENRIKSLESKWNSMNETLNKSPQVNNHFQKMAGAAEKASERIVSVMNTAKAAVLAVMTAKAGSGAFKWAIGSEDVAKAKIFAKPLMDPEATKAFEGEMANIRKSHVAAKDDLILGSYEINSAMSDKPLKDQLETYKLMPYYMTLLNKSFKESAQFYKGFLASFGDRLPADKQKTFAVDTLGMLAGVGKMTKASPSDIAAGLGKLGALYGDLGQSESQLFADIAYMSPMMGNKPEEASTAIKALVARQGGTVKKLAEAKYEFDYVRGRLEGTQDWGSIENLRMAAKMGDKRAQHDIAEMEANKDFYAAKLVKQAEAILHGEKNMPKFWQFMGGLVDEIKRDPGSRKQLAEALGEEHSNAAIGLIGAYKDGTIQRIKQEIEAFKGQDYIDKVGKEQSEQLPHLWGLVTQGAEDLSASLRSIFYEPMKMLLEEWKAVFTKLEGDFAGEGGLQRIKSFSGSFMGGLRSGWNDGKVVDDNKSLGQIFQDFVAGLGAEDWKAAGQKIGSAATDFVNVAGQLKDIVGSAHRFMSKWGLISPAVKMGVAATLTPGGPIAKGVSAGLVLADEAADTEFIKSKGYSQDILDPFGGEAKPLPKQQPTEMAAPPWKKAWQPLPADPVAMGFTPPGFGMGDVNVNLKTTVMVDGKELKSEIADEVVEKTIERIEGDMARRRANATDHGQVGGY